MSELSLSASGKTATVVGATGLTGSHLLRQLAAHRAYTRVVALSRKRPTPLPAGVEWLELPAATAERLARAGETADLGDAVPPGDDFFSCLGTTRARAGSAAAFEAVDYALNRGLADAALAAGYNQYLLVSSVGADPRSAFLYPRVKGELELYVRGLPFWSVHLFRPGVLLGERNENRWGERLAKPLMRGLDRLTRGALGRYRPIEAGAVARAMVAAAQRTSGGIFVHANDELQVLAEAYSQT